MYSPPAPRTIDAILAKLSEPRNLRGFISTYSPLSSKKSISSSSLGKSVFTAVTVPAPPLVAGGLDVAVTEGVTPAAFNAFEMSVRSLAMSFKTTRTSSILWVISSSDDFFSLIASPQAYYLRGAASFVLP